jgi:integrase
MIRQICNWAATRDDNYTSPIIRGMSRGERKSRDRILSDGEIRDVWAAAATCGSFGRLVRFALLTAQRRDKLAEMRWDDLEGNVWKIRTDEREKGNAGELVLPALALEVLGERGIGYVFPTQRGNKHSSWDDHKRGLDKKSGVTGWTLHDLRRSARSLMSRAGVQPHIAELTLGHVQQGVQAIYDRHTYVAEKGDALAKLAGLLALILNPPAGNVVDFGKRTA